MSGTSFDLGQFTQVSSAVLKALPKALAELDPKAVIAVVEKNGEQLEGLLHGVFSTMLTPLAVAVLPPLLVFDDARFASVDISGEHDPVAFWWDTDEAPARRVWGTFQTTVVARARPIAPQGIVNVPYADTSRNTTVREIMEAPGVGDHDPSKLSRLIAAMIARQPKGKYLKNGLLNDGRGNFFKCGSVLARVRWDGVRRRWGVSGWRPDGGVRAGRRVFSGNLKF